MSLLQKAIRRGRKDLALRAAATLLHGSPERLWRRLGCIAFEDIGVADLDTVAIATAALAGKRCREELGGEWRIAACIVSRMASASKCRASDDLLLAAEKHPDFEDARLALAFRSVDYLIRIATGADPLPIRALAAWYAIGTDRRPSPGLSSRQGEADAVFNALRQRRIPAAVVEIAREGFRKTGEVLCPFVALLWPLRQKQKATIENDDPPAEALIGDIPGWAYDVYSREGRAALANFIEGRTEPSRWVCDHIPPRQRVAFLGTIVFRLEGGCVRNRFRWKTGDELRRMVDIECNGPHCHDASEILSLMRHDIPVLNGVRSQLNGGSGASASTISSPWAHLRRILKTYACYYNKIRTHRSLDKDAPVSRPVQRTGRIISRPIPGELHHHYIRA
jgi:hypothetical protein